MRDILSFGDFLNDPYAFSFLEDANDPKSNTRLGNICLFTAPSS